MAAKAEIHVSHDDLFTSLLKRIAIYGRCISVADPHEARQQPVNNIGPPKQTANQSNRDPPTTGSSHENNAREGENQKPSSPTNELQKKLRERRLNCRRSSVKNARGKPPAAVPSVTINDTPLVNMAESIQALNNEAHKISFLTNHPCQPPPTNPLLLVNL